MNRLILFSVLYACLNGLTFANAQITTDRPATKLQYTKWSGELNIPDPVSICFDDLGRAYVTQTRRRKIQDLDIRQNRNWIPTDVGLQSVAEKQTFYRTILKPGVEAAPGQANSKHVEDVNKDGSHDYRDLMVISEQIHLVQDTDQNGTADKIALYAEDFKTEVTGIAAGVLHHDGELYTTIAPDVWKLRDTDGDGKSDEREIIASGFGIHIAYAGHDMHGLTVGPDGKIYWTIGDKGISVTSKEGKRFHYPNQGGVLRCNPDGSDLEVFAHGLRNVQELAFDQFGNLFGFDNDSDQPDERERFIHIVEGMDAGWRCNYQYRGDQYNPWTEERMWEPFDATTSSSQPRFIIPPIVNSVNGPCGFAFNPGTALSADYKDYFFLTSTLGGEQISFKIEPHGDSFKMVNEHQIGKGIPMIGINFAPDGGLYGVDWAGGYPLNQKGHIWKIDVGENPDAKHMALRKKIAHELKTDFAELSVGQLIRRLASPDQRVRLKSQFELVRRNDQVALIKVYQAPEKHTEIEDQIPRIHAVWGLGQLARKNNEIAKQWFQEVLSISNFTDFNNDDSQLNIALVRTARDLPDLGYDTLGFLRGGIVTPHLQQESAITYGKQGGDSAFLSLQKFATNLKADQAYLRHAITQGLAGIEYRRIVESLSKSSDAEIRSRRLEDLANHENTAVRLCGIIAIRKLSSLLNNDGRQLSGNFLKYLKDSNVQIATEAARTIHDDFSINYALPQLASMLNNSRVNREAYLRRSINANFRVGSKQSLVQVALFAADDTADPRLRFEALDAIANWSHPDVLDRVTGRHRRFARKRHTDLSIIKGVLLLSLKSETDRSVKQNELFQPAVALISTLRKLNFEIPKVQLLQIYHSKLSDQIRAQALVSLFENHNDIPNGSELAAVLENSIQSDSRTIRISALRIASEKAPEVAIKRIRVVLQPDSESSRVEQQLAIKQLGTIATLESDEILQLLLKRMSAGKLAVELQLETLESAQIRSTSHEGTQILLNQFLTKRRQLVKGISQRASDEKDLALYLECTSGGDPAQGKKIFNTNIDAQCVRCHRVGKKGSTVGPELADVAIRKPANSDALHLLRSIVAPSADIDEKYQTVLFMLESGKTIQGVVVREKKNSIVIADATGQETVLQKDEIEDEKKQKVSIMPLAKTLTKREIRDLVAYLKTLKAKK